MLDKLYDIFGRFLPLKSLPKKPEGRVLSSVELHDRWSEYPTHGLTPQKLAAIFKEADQGDVRRQAEMFEEMEEKDAHLFSQFQTRKLAVQGLPWDVIPIDESGEAVKISEFCRKVIAGLPNWDENLLDMLDAIAKGYSMMEIVWDVSEGSNSISALKWIHPKKVTFWNSMTPRVLTEEEPFQGIDLIPFKFIYHRYKARSGYDTRAGVMRCCAWMYLFKNYDVKDWVAFAEIYGQPLRLGKYDQRANKDDKEALIAAVRSIGTDAAGIISKSTEIAFVETANKTGTVDLYERLANWCDAQMSKAIIGQTLTSDSGHNVGSFALGKVHSQVRQDLVESDCSAIQTTMHRQFLLPLVGFNFGWDKIDFTPNFRILFEVPDDLKAIAETYEILAGMGFDMSQEHISERFKVPIRKEKETPLRKTALPEPPITAKRYIASSRRVDEGQQAVDALVDMLPPDALDPVLEPLMEVITKARSYEEILSAIHAQHRGADPSKLREIVHKAMFAANLWGMVTAKK